MNINKQVQTYVKNVENKANSFYAKHQSVKRFQNPKFEDSEVQERIMRLRVEATATKAHTNDELYMLACATLHEDYIKSPQYTRTYYSSNEFNKLFENQSNFGGSYLYMASNNEGVLQVFSTPSVSELSTRFKRGYLKNNSLIPFLE